MANMYFASSDEKFLKSVVFYATADEGYLFADKDATIKVDKDDVTNFFMKGLLVVEFNGTFYAPVAYAITDNTYGTVTVSGDGVDYTFVTKEYTAPTVEDDPEGTD